MATPLTETREIPARITPYLLAGVPPDVLDLSHNGKGRRVRDLLAHIQDVRLRTARRACDNKVSDDVREWGRSSGPWTVQTVRMLVPLVVVLATLTACSRPSPSPPRTDWREAPASDWRVLFNGRDLDGWTVKLAHHEVGDNYADTFRVVDGAIAVRYDGYGDDFGERFGHLFFNEPFSHYVLALEYRIRGPQQPGGPSYARLNSGVMVHSQSPQSILKDQDWPISVEAQFLAGDQTTMNVCTPGTEIVMNGTQVAAHCTNSSSRRYVEDGDWVPVQVEVLGHDVVRHYVDGQLVLQYEHPTIGGGVANGYDPEFKVDGRPLSSGYIGLQAESQPVEFRNIRLLDLSGCMVSSSSAYRSYFVHRDDTRCR